MPKTTIDIAKLIDGYYNAEPKEGQPKLTAGQFKAINNNKVLEFLQFGLNEEVEKLVAKVIERNRPMTEVGEASTFDPFFPENKRQEAEKAFDECGSVQILIRRNTVTCKVEIQKLGEDIVPATEDEIEQQELEQARAEPQRPIPALINGSGLSLYIGVPTARRLSPAVTYSIQGQIKRTPDARIQVTENVAINIARNVIANEFVKSDRQWLWMQDDDIIAPFGSAAMLHQITGMKNEERFMSLVASEALTKSGKMFVGGVYCTRNAARQLCCNIGMRAEGPADEELAKDIKLKGARDGLLRMKWIGFGCVAIHRQVFEALQKHFPELEKNGMWDYFDFKTGGEDISFCQRAERAGHPPHLDLSVWCSHVGNTAFNP